MTHAFSLKLTGSALLGALGERWALMVVITALRLWALKGNGRTNKTVLAMGEKTGQSNSMDELGNIREYLADGHFLAIRTTMTTLLV
jgi:hypothetical protein